MHKGACAAAPGAPRRTSRLSCGHPAGRPEALAAAGTLPRARVRAPRSPPTPPLPDRRLPPCAGTIKATCLIETLPAAFEMDEFIYELRDHMAGGCGTAGLIAPAVPDQRRRARPLHKLARAPARDAAACIPSSSSLVSGWLHPPSPSHNPGLNCGRWDYMFSFIKTMRNDPSRVMPDRSFLTMEMPFMRAYTQVGRGGGVCRAALRHAVVALLLMMMWQLPPLHRRCCAFFVAVSCPHLPPPAHGQAAPPLLLPSPAAPLVPTACCEDVPQARVLCHGRHERHDSYQGGRGQEPGGGGGRAGWAAGGCRAGERWGRSLARPHLLALVSLPKFGSLLLSSLARPYNTRPFPRRRR